MSVNFNGKKVSAFPGILIKSRDKISDAVVAFENVNNYYKYDVLNYFGAYNGNMRAYNAEKIFPYSQYTNANYYLSLLNSLN